MTTATREVSTDLRYPVGKFKAPQNLTAADREPFIANIAAAPARLREALHGLTPTQLDTPYRPDGWTVRQVAHHVPDSHMTAYLRMKLALTENEPAIKAYDEKLWAELPDTRDTPVEASVALLEALHQRWVVLLRSMSDADYTRTYRHTEMGVVTLNTVLALYSWHSRHHVAHITSLRQRMGW